MATILQRARAAASAAVGIFSESAARDAHGMLSNLYRLGGEPPDRGAEGQLGVYGTNPRARSAFGLIASSMAAVDWKLYIGRKTVNGQRVAYRDRQLQKALGQSRKDLLQSRRNTDELDEVTDHPALDFINAGSALLPGVSSRRVQQLHMDLVGETFLLKGRNALKTSVNAWPIPPTWVKGTPTPQDPFYRVQYRGWNVPIPDADILWVRDPDPANPYTRGVGYGKALADELEADEYAAKTVRQLFFNRARPDFIVYPDGDRAEMGDANMKRFEQDWTNRLQGFWRAWKPYFANRKIGIHEFTQNFEHLQFTELRSSMRDAINQTLGIPPEKLGIIENSNRSTIDAADLIFAKNVLVPRLEFWRSYYQTCLIPEYDPRLIIDYVTPVTEDREFFLKVATTAPWTLDGNEYRALMGQEPKDEYDGVIMLPASGTPVNLEDILEPPEPIVPDTGMPPDVPEDDEEPAGKMVIQR